VRGRVSETKTGVRGDALLLMNTIGAINPRMPLCWRGVALWPDGLPGLLAAGIAGDADLLVAAEELLVHDIATGWSLAEQRQDCPSGPDIFAHRAQIGGSNGMLRLFYGLNPMLPCRAEGFSAGWVSDIPGLMRGLERNAGKAGDTMIDLHLAAFIGARAERNLEMQVIRLATMKTADAQRRGELTLLRDLQVRYHPEPLPNLTKWVANRLRPDLARWRNKARRQAIEERLQALTQAGLLARLLTLFDDVASRTQDLAGMILAAKEVAAIDAETSAIDRDEVSRLTEAQRTGHAIIGGVGLSAFILAVMSVLLR
jgi:eukaryotic-like serine/threonine-protein kinase